MSILGIGNKSSTKKIGTFINEFVKQESFGGILLFLAAIVAMIAANSPILSHAYFSLWELKFGISIADYSFIKDVHFWVNDGLMALFFLMVGLEVKRELLVGELSSFQKAISPIFASVGGMLFPILIFLYCTWGSGNEHGFAIPMGTDTAFALGVLLLLGNRIPIKLKVFLVTLAIADDIGSILVIAVFYTNTISYFYLMLAILVTSILFLFNRSGVKTLIVYFLGGIILWYFFYKSGIHATISGIALAFCIPIRSKINSTGFLEHLRLAVNVFYSNAPKQDTQQVLLTAKQNNALEIIAKAYDEVQSPLVRLEHYLHPLSAYFIMPIFALANAGVKIEQGFEFNEMFWGIALGLFVGKPLGIFAFTYILDFFGISRKPSNLTWTQILGVGLVAGIGFTMSILISNLAYKGVADQATLSVLITSLAATVVSFVFFFIFAPKENITTTSVAPTKETI
ncbi:MAG: Na+/H+ antiporter NhaA [Campylobacteraceae bacterium]|nr:Na+/H+ antiporter NhaA [Campylobacteraceae bacterium]